ncbi:hypothetical protein BD779DRAFT_1504241 [Infundibulicybe gibba]|nr:hypothetical protein BD779DRAFT_1504241 [Infundibulicybe gibba]
MLPTPISSGKPRTFRRTPPAHRRKVVDVLLSRSRITNLAVLLLAALLVISLLYNLRLCRRLILIGGSDLNTGGFSMMKTMTRPDPIKYLNHLIMVPGHAIWKGIDSELRLHEEEWILEPYQRGGDRVATFFRHISQGAELVVEDEHALLVFSGGQTRLSSTTTEAESYLRLAVNANLFQTLASVPHFPRATTEDHALDSFQNLVFSIARFREYVGRYPENITVIGYEFKRQRFTDLHRAALRWPQDRFHYIGVDPPNGHSVKAEHGEVRPSRFMIRTRNKNVFLYSA